MVHPSRQSLALLIACGALAGTSQGQSVLDHPPNLSGGWVVPHGTMQVNIQHRFDASPPPLRKVTSFPTLTIGAGMPGRTMIGLSYSTNSQLSPGFPNEWEFFGRWRPLTQETGSAVDLGGGVGYNLAAEGFDAELSLGRRFGRLGLIGVARVLSDPDTGSAGAQFALGGGATLRLLRWLAIQGDYAALAERPAGTKAAWSAGLALGIPTTPHSFALFASNAVTSTAQGASRGTEQVLYGFEFTVPITLARWIRRDAAPATVADAPLTGPVRTIVINRLAFTQVVAEIPRGTTIIWKNEDLLAHTVTADDGSFASGMIEPGSSWSYTFNAPGSFAYHCTPHPFMKARVEVR